MIAVIPAAGRGTRMGELTNELPKPMLPLWGKPILGHILGELGRAEVKEVILIVGYKADVIHSYIGNGEKFGLKVEYVFQEKPLGTAHAIKLAERKILPRWHFLVQFADIIVPAGWYDILFSIFSLQWDGILTLDRSDYSQGAAVVMDAQNRVEKIIEKPAPDSIPTKFNNAGIALLSYPVLDFLPQTYRDDEEISFPAVVDKWIDSGARVKGVEIPEECYIDVKNLEAYAKLQKTRPPKFLRG